MVRWWPARSLDRNGLVRNPSGAAATTAAPKTFMRIVAWGQTMAHLPQSMQTSGSQMGISLAIERFSYFVVPVGNVPSTGSALTGRRSPSPLISIVVTRCTKSGASSGTVTSIDRTLVATTGTSTRWRLASAVWMAAKLRSMIARPRFAYVDSTAALIFSMATSGGSTPESWKKQGCITVLMRLPISASRATRFASITHSWMSLSRISRCTSMGKWSHTSSGAKGEFSRNVAPGRAYGSTFSCSSRPNWWQATKSAPSIR
jgi:hypothetical protein